VPGLSPLTVDQIEKIAFGTKRLRHRLAMLFDQIWPRSPRRDKLAQEKNCTLFLPRVTPGLDECPPPSYLQRMNEIRTLTKIMARLRSPKGCPWDRKQTHRTLRPMILEEVYELLEAIDQGDDQSLREELGDVLLHIIFHAQLAKERKAFDFRAVAKELAEKLVRRHPHVFGKERIITSSQVLKRWHQLKQEEKPTRRSSLDGVPRHLPALLRAQNLQKRAARVGFEWPNPSRGIPAKIREELKELSQTRGRGPAFTRELGDLLFTLVNLARHRKVDAESACRDAAERFAARVRSIETQLAKKGLKTTDLNPRQLDQEWKKAKKRRLSY